MTNRPYTGWVIVPRSATGAMEVAAGRASQQSIGSWGEPGISYEAAISAAPSPLDDAELVERVRDELLAHCVCTERSEGLNREWMLKAARAAITAIITPKER